MATIRDIKMLIPIVQLAWMEVEAELESLGIEIKVVETLRLPATQRAYYAQGREPLHIVNGKRKMVGLGDITEEQNERVITRTLDSMHFYEIALDFVLIINGKMSWNTKADINEDDIVDYENVGLIAEKHGFKWGGRFSFKDYAHLEYRDGLTLAELQAGKRPSEDVLKYKQQRSVQMDTEKVKKGVRTSEFYMAIIGAMIPILNTHLGFELNPTAIMSIAGVAVTYIISRAVVKGNAK